MDANLYTEGSIYFYENTERTKKDYHNPDLNQDFITSRPVYVLDSRSDLSFETYSVNVLLLTSSIQRPGIPVNIDGYRNGRIMPYGIHSVRKEYLTKYMGRVSDDLKETIRDAMKYHLNLSEEKPEYLIEHERNEEKKRDIISKFTKKELTVYNCVAKMCAIKDIYYEDFQDLFTFYIEKFFKLDHYEKPQNFSKALLKVMQLFPHVYYEKQFDRVIVHGVSIGGSVTHKEELGKNKHKRKITTDKGSKTTYSELEIEQLSSNEIIHLLSEKSYEYYQKMDMVDKISNWRCNETGGSIELEDAYEKRLIKKLISLEMTEKKHVIMRRLDNGESPFNLSNVNQFMVYKFTNDEILAHVNPRLYKKGISHFRRKIRFNIGYLLKK